MAQILKTIRDIRLGNLSVNGNPSWYVTFTDGSEARTSSDAAVSYEIGNPEMCVGSRVAVTYTRAGRIAYMRSIILCPECGTPAKPHSTDSELWDCPSCRLRFDPADWQ